MIAKWAPVYPENNEGLTEFHHYRQFRSSFGESAKLRCPVPLAFCGEHNVLLTEEDAGMPFRDLCRSPLAVTRRSAITQASRMCAMWLRAFHEFEPSTRVRIGSALSRLPRLSPSLFNFELASGQPACLAESQVREYIEKKLRLLRSCSSRCAVGRIHKDFGPGNILFSKSHLTVLDAAANESGPQLFDVADFTAYLHLLPVITLHTQRACWRFAKVFLQTYLESARLSAGERALLNLLTIGATLRNIERQIAQLNLLRGPARRLALRYCTPRYQAILNRLMKQGQEAADASLVRRSAIRHLKAVL